MKKVVCPHCRAEQTFHPNPPRDMAVVMGCPECQELMVLFHGKVIAVNRQILISGTREERKAHLADIVEPFLEEFLKSGFLGIGHPLSMGTEDLTDVPPPEFAPDHPATDRPITQKEFERFLKIDLKCIDNPTYFHRHFD